MNRRCKSALSARTVGYEAGFQRSLCRRAALRSDWAFPSLFGVSFVKPRAIWFADKPFGIPSCNSLIKSLTSGFFGSFGGEIFFSVRADTFSSKAIQHSCDRNYRDQRENHHQRTYPCCFIHPAPNIGYDREPE